MPSSSSAKVVPPKAAPAPKPAPAPVPPKTEAPLDISKPDPAVIDMDTLGQLLDMDDDDSHSFSKPLMQEYNEQAESTLKEIEAALADDKQTKAQRLSVLSAKGHFLKGSSAALGIIKVRDSCESLQNLGKRKNESGAGDIKEEDAWQRCSELLPRLRKEHEEAQKWLAAFVDM